MPSSRAPRGSDSTSKAGQKSPPWFDQDAPLHVDAAAKAAALAITRGEPGIYNIAEDDGAVASEKAKRQFAWSGGWRNPNLPAAE
jgi:hypothetical protein